MWPLSLTIPSQPNTLTQTSVGTAGRCGLTALQARVSVFESVQVQGGGAKTAVTEDSEQLARLQ